MSGTSRKYLPAEGYRLLALAFLAHRAADGATKGELAWETRANHYMATRMLRDLADQGCIAVQGDADKGFQIRVTPAGQAFLDRHRDYLLRTHGPILRAHFRYGRRPVWLDALLA